MWGWCREIRKWHFAISWCAVSWSFWLLCIPTVSYALAAAVYGYQRNWPLAIVYYHYAGANIGLLWLDRVLAK